jgi:hypothetical protein
MSENDPTLSPGLLPSPAPAPGRSARKATIAFLIIFILLAGGVSVLRHNAPGRFPLSAPNVAVAVAPAVDTNTPSAIPPPSDQRLTEMDDKIQALGNEIHTLSAKVEASDHRLEASASKEASADIPRLESDVAALASAVSGIQSEIKRTGATAEQSQKMTQVTLATAIAFIRLRETALSGQPFSGELTAMRTAARNDGDFQEQIAKLGPFAAGGAQNIVGLQNEFLAHEKDAASAVDRAMARTLWDKLLAELQTFVSVRRLNGGDSDDPFVTIESALAHGDVGAALNGFKAMPAAAQSALKDWRTDADARQQVDAALRTMAEHFTAMANPSLTPTQDTP